MRIDMSRSRRKRKMAKHGANEDKWRKLKKEWYAVTVPLKEKLVELHADCYITCKGDIKHNKRDEEAWDEQE